MKYCLKDILIPDLYYLNSDRKLVKSQSVFSRLFSTSFKRIKDDGSSDDSEEDDTCHSIDEDE